MLKLSLKYDDGKYERVRNIKSVLYPSTEPTHCVNSSTEMPLSSPHTRNTIWSSRKWSRFAQFGTVDKNNGMNNGETSKLSDA